METAMDPRGMAPAEEWRSVRRMVQARGVAGPDVDDLTQEVWLVLWQQADVIEPRAELPASQARMAFAFGVSVRRVLRHRRGYARRRAVEHRAAEQPASHEAPSAEDLALEAEARALFLEAVEELRRSTPAQHAVLVLHLSGSSNVEIAAVLGLAVDTVGGRLRRARAAVTAFVRRRMAQDECYARRRSMRR